MPSLHPSAVASREYRKTEKGKASLRRYRATEGAKAAHAKYTASEKGRSALARARKKAHPGKSGMNKRNRLALIARLETQAQLYGDDAS